MFATLNLQLVTTNAAVPPADTSHSQAPFSEFLKIPESIPVSGDYPGGELLPADGTILPVLPVLPETHIATSGNDISWIDVGAQPLEKNLHTSSTLSSTPATETAIVLELEYAAEEIVAEPVLPALELPAVIAARGPQATNTALQSAVSAEVGVRLGADVGSEQGLQKEMPPVASVALPIQDLAVPKAENGFVMTNAVPVLRENAVRAAAGLPVSSIPLIDGMSESAELPEGLSLNRVIAAVETLQQPENRHPGGQNTQSTPPLQFSTVGSSFLTSGPAPIATPVRSAAWGEQLGDRVLFMAGSQMKTAEIRLTPADMGPLRVQVSVDDGTANLSFHAPHALTRDAIEQALPRLREMMAESGLSLGQADVSEHGVAGGNGEPDDDRSSTAAFGGSDDAGDAAGDEPTERRKSVSLDALVDTFA